MEAIKQEPSSPDPEPSPSEGADMESETEAKDAKRRRLQINMSVIPSLPSEEQEFNLEDLGVTAYDQSRYEQGVMSQIDEALQHEVPSRKATSTSKQSGNVSRIVLSDDFQTPELSPLPAQDSESEDDTRDDKKGMSSEDEWVPEASNVRRSKLLSSEEEDEDIEDELVDGKLPFVKGLKRKRTAPVTKPKKQVKSEDDYKLKKIRDDGCEKYYQKRIKDIRNEKLLKEQESGFKTVEEYKELDGGFRIPKTMWNKLFRYQKACVKWLWELHQHGVGGVVGDEMGLGKTIQIIAFLTGLKCSTINNFREGYESLGPVVIVCPATVMHQWVQELNKWYPSFRVGILHNTGSYPHSKKKGVISLMNKTNGILITTFQGVVDYQDYLYEHEWHYVILDEGHKIRNPDAQVTIACKRFKTPHRIILSGSPIQNNLRELWSLFDFVYPGKLGTLPVFMEQFAVPITQGGYSNATDVQVQIGFKCATVLRDAIKPYLLRRLKDDVKDTLNLPDKNEQVLFCKLTDEQRDIYQQYIDSATIKEIVKGSTQIFVGLTNLRKICNHPDLFLGATAEIPHDHEDFGYYKKSGKMKVVDALLRQWSKQEHKVLIFSQGTKMQDLLEKFLRHRDYTYLRMDGSTPIGSRQQLIQQFNNDSKIFAFLLTTRVGGLGVNLTGAQRVLIYDPDWNPSTDLQARERAWRIGQDKKVTIYRLLTAGTIEEKMYHRQVFKQYLTNRVLKDPKQRRFFKTNDLYELFTLGDADTKTESSAIFAGTGSDVHVKKKAKNPNTKSSKEVKSGHEEAFSLPPEKILELRERAKMLSQMLSASHAKANGTAASGVSKASASPASDNPIASSSSAPAVDKKRKRSEKRKKGVLFEGERIKYLVKHDMYKRDEDAVLSEKQDDYVLKKLFKKSAVHSALQHDVIEGATNPDYVLVETEADKVASDAIKALKQSRRNCYRATSGIPTWTGQNGGSSNKKPLFGQRANANSSAQSSGSLLQTMKARSKLGPSRNDDADEDAAPDVVPENEELLQDIRSFLVGQSHLSGEASTQELLDKFSNRLPRSQTPVFKAFLNKICDFHRNSGGTGMWRLKEDFR